MQTQSPEFTICDVCDAVGDNMFTSNSTLELKKIELHKHQITGEVKHIYLNLCPDCFARYAVKTTRLFDEMFEDHNNNSRGLQDDKPLFVFGKKERFEQLGYKAPILETDRIYTTNSESSNINPNMFPCPPIPAFTRVWFKGKYISGTGNIECARVEIMEGELKGKTYDIYPHTITVD